MTRRQLPPQIKKITVTDRRTKKAVVRYQVTVDAGESSRTGKRQQVRWRYATEKQARDALAETPVSYDSTMAAATGSTSFCQSSRVPFVTGASLHSVRQAARCPSGSNLGCPRYSSSDMGHSTKQSWRDTRHRPEAKRAVRLRLLDACE